MRKLLPMLNRRLLLLITLIGVSTPALSNEVEIVETLFERHGNSWTVHTTLRHDDTGWDHYADKWRVVDEKGTLLGERVLFHPHETEQPFTRSQSGIVIDPDTRIVFVEAHDKVHGWSKQRIRVDLKRDRGSRYRVK